MTSQKKINANRENAAASTGPRSLQGKLLVSQNPVKHGLTSKKILLPTENPRSLAKLAKALRVDWNPQGAQEELQVEIMIHAAWGLRRFARVEAGIFTWHHYNILAERARRKARTYEADGSSSEDVVVLDEGKRKKAMAQARRMRKLQKKSTAILGLAFTRGSSGVDAFSKVSRYATTLERRYYRALHELQRLKAARSGGRVPLPLALDVTVSGGDEDDPDHPIGALRAHPA